MKAPEQRIGLYGGAFDPPHLAHEALAQAAVKQFALDELVILPTGYAWHKSRSLTAATHRIAMTQLAFADVPQARVDDREILRSGATYTIDTLNEIQAENPQAELFLLMGQDQLAFFPQWHKYQEILQIATLLVALRADFIPASSPNGSQNRVKMEFSTIHMPASPISATQIRQFCTQHQAIDHLVKPSVARYIAQHRLYLPS
ncbi:MAG: nicotinate (nicotinamide) nucleotide adenylyltransferase [Burkholderiales bacterium]|nr:MAG: nicotinate (nicotinamide) nucleotide adenylyltransferase [Burkholderiales bacterium]